MAATSVEAHSFNLGVLTIPTLVAWARDDRLIEAEIFDELSPKAPDGPRLPFDTGGHNIQKSQASELADAIVAFMGDCLNGASTR